MAVEARPRLVARRRTADSPLSFAQSRLWFLNRLQGQRPNYNEIVEVPFGGPFDADALAAALVDVVERHEGLRTIFPEVQGIPRQVVLDASAVPAIVTAESAPGRVRNDVAEAARVEFDLTTEPPLRAHLFVVAPDWRVLVLVVHHIAVDWWSIHGVLIQELRHAYERRRAGAAPAFEPLPLQYADYASWHLEVLGDAGDPQSLIARQLAFWTATLAGAPEELALPADYPRPAIATYRGDGLTLLIDRILHERLVALARHNSASLFMLLHAAVAALLTRLGAGTDIPIGSPISGRRSPLVKNVVGFFANTIVIRTDTSGNPTFRTLLARVRRRVLEASGHDDAPFERVVEAVNPPRSLSRNPLFQVMLGLHTTAVLGHRAQSVRRLRTVPRVREHARFDLTFDFVERRGPDHAPMGIVGTLQFSADLFHPATVRRIEQQLIALLRLVAEDPDRPIEHLDVMSEAERRAQLAAGKLVGSAPCLIERFHDRATQTPEAPAVTCEGRSVTYATLRDRSNQLAHLLRARGIGREDRVGVAVSRSIDLAICLLGVLTAGATYVPLDPEHPAQHLAALVHEVRPRVVLVTDATARTIDGAAPVLVLDDGEVAAALAQSPASDPEWRPMPDSAACITMTAGTTGPPKPVITTHHALSRLLSSVEIAMPRTSGARFLVTTSIGADLAALEMLLPLVSGGEAILASDEDVLYPSRLAQFIDDRGPLIVQGTAIRLRALARHLGARRPGVTFLVGRDAADADLVSALQRASGDVVHLYGATETTLWNASVPLGVDAQTPAPIGRPLADDCLYVLDRHLQPVPTGGIGDLYVGGGGVARGYAGRHGLTAEWFVADPHGAAGARMFRTGDRARWAHDGLLQLVERAGVGPRDLDRIESAIRELPNVADAVAIVQGGVEGRARHVAYVTAIEGHVVDLDAARAHLEARLRRDLVPHAIVGVDRWPLTPNGTLDRRALSARTLPDADRHGDPTPAEAQLITLFAEVLGRSDIGPNDSFFDKGGHSLSVMKLMNRIRSSMGIEVDARTIFEAQTVAAISRQLDAS
jgi:amino acid adenylation domain-containing protein